MAKNENLHKAKIAKNDEFYTMATDIEKELKHYKNHFKDKIVFCNCDDPTESEFWRYFHLNFGHLGLKKLISTHYDSEKPTYKMEYEGGSDADYETGIKTPLAGNGDFRSEECLKLLDEADVVVTNPPWSLFREYLDILEGHHKKFVIIGNKNAITYKEVFPLLKDNKVWLGYGSASEFLTPEGKTKKVQGLARWFTNLDIPKRHEDLILWKHYTPEEYPKYDNYDAINVNKVSEIPCDYDGVMGVPITFADSYNASQFEIVGISKTWATDFEVKKTKIYTSAYQYSKGRKSSGNKINDGGALVAPDHYAGTYYIDEANPDVKLMQVYARIFIRRKV